MDRVTLVQMKTPKLISTYGKYCMLELGSTVKSVPCIVQRIDIVFDVYIVGFQKLET